MIIPTRRFSVFAHCGDDVIAHAETCAIARCHRASRGLCGQPGSVFFFFSSRRRHTRCSRDWSSDVCSSDLDGRDKPGHDGFSGKRMARLAGKDALVTGSAKGIGRHYSQALAAEGARGMIADIEDGGALAQELAQKHGADSAASAAFDVSDEPQVQALVKTTLQRFGQIDVLVNNRS